MNKFLSAALVSASALLSLSFLIPPAQAADVVGPWGWTDISDAAVTYHTNRPIWAVARAGNYWYYTDGQELWDGGQVYRADATTASNITLDVRQALGRVDDIVSDGQTVLFLKNVTARNNTFEVVAYNGTYTNVTSPLRAYFSSDEGIADIKGVNGTWLIVTTKSRVLRGNLFGTFTQLTSAVSAPYSDIAYSSRHASPADGLNYLPIATAPLGNGWLVAMRDSSQNVTRFFRYDASGASIDVTYTMGRITNVQAMAGNGNRVLIAGIDNTNPSAVKVYSTDGVTAADVSWSAANLPAWNWLRSRVVWDGTSWMLTSDKQLARFDSSYFQAFNSGIPDAYFLSLAGDGQGRFMLGGARSLLGPASSPSYPLTAALAMASEQGVSTPIPYLPTPAPTPAPVPQPSSSNGVYTSNNLGISNWEWVSPNVSTLAPGQKTTFYIQAQTWTRLRRLSVWVNGSLKTICNYSPTTATKTCSYTLAGSSYKPGTKLSVRAKITDKKNRVMWTNPLTLTVPSAPAPTPSPAPASKPSATWIWTIPGDNGVLSYPSTFHIGAWDADGMARVEVWTNGVMRRVCDFASVVGNVECTLDVQPQDYANGTTVTARSRVVDSLGHETWSDIKTWTVNAAYSNPSSNPYTPPYQTAPVYISAWTEPQTSMLLNGSSLVYRASASSADGLNRIELFANGALIGQCNYGQVYGAQTCNATVYWSSYSGTVSLTARGTSAAGVTNTTDAKVIAVEYVQPQPPVNNPPIYPPGTVTVTTDHASGYGPYDQVTFTVSANDQNGVSKLELLVNAIPVKTCTNASVCSWTGGPYGARGEVTYGANMTDAAGYSIWTGYKYIVKK